MKSIKKTLLAASSALSLCASPGFAQEAGHSDETGVDANTIIVNARRRDEVLQDIPSTVVAVTADVLAKNRITSTADISQLVPGLSIDGSRGVATGGAATSIRGVATFANSAATPLVQYYMNDAPAGRGPDFFMPVIFDIGRVEVIKGPQGTLRGLSSPSGAISISTRMPDLDEVGGSAFLSGTHIGTIDAQAAVGVPLINGVLGLRVAGAYQDSDLDGVKSVSVPKDPSSRIWLGRATLLFKPSPDFEASVMYQHLDSKVRRVSQVAGPGNGIGGPAIDASQRLGTTDGQTRTSNNTDFVVGKLDWTFAGQKLSYVGSYRYSDLPSSTAADVANAVRGVEFYNDTFSNDEEISHELRLSSDERIGGIFDYVAGIFYDQNKGSPVAFQPSSFLSGAFGRPGTLPVAQDPLARYTLPVTISIRSNRKETSPFANLTAHLFDNRLELSGGVRHYHVSQNNFTVLRSGDAYNAIIRPAQVPSCSFVPGAAATSFYGAGTCDVLVPGSVLSDTTALGKSKFNKWLYNFSASFKVIDELMIYANTGSAVRTLSPTSGIIGITDNTRTQATFPNLASMNDLVLHPPETSKNYEVGFKSTLFGGRAYFNAAYFRQDFKNFVFFGDPVNYASISNPAAPLSTTGNRVSSFRFTTSAASAKAQGFEIEAGMRVSSRFNFNLGVTYSKSNLNNSRIPCNDGNFDGTPDNITPTLAGFLGANVLVARCAANGSISRLPNWVLTAQAEYKAPVSNRLEAFVRGNVAYRPDNPNATTVLVVQNYALANLFAGIRDPQGAWEVMVFANNAFNRQQILGRDAIPLRGPADAFFFGAAQSGYFGASYTPRREVGLSVRYAFGSR